MFPSSCCCHLTWQPQEDSCKLWWGSLQFPIKELYLINYLVPRRCALMGTERSWGLIRISDGLPFETSIILCPLWYLGLSLFVGTSLSLYFFSQCLYPISSWLCVQGYTSFITRASPIVLHMDRRLRLVRLPQRPNPCASLLLFEFCGQSKRWLRCLLSRQRLTSLFLNKIQKQYGRRVNTRAGWLVS